MLSARSAQCPAGRAEFDVMLNYQRVHFNKISIEVRGFPRLPRLMTLEGKKCALPMDDYLPIRSNSMCWLMYLRWPESKPDFEELNHVFFSHLQDPTNPTKPS